MFRYSLERIMKQLSFLPIVTFGQAWHYQQDLSELRQDYLCGYINELDKPVGMSWDDWYKYVVIQED